MERLMSYSRRFESFMRLLNFLEGGYSDDPRDSGGKTMHGITSATYDSFVRRNKVVTKNWPNDVRDITLEHAKYIYFIDYWINPEISNLPDEMAKHVFIAGVNIGPIKAIQRLQMALNAGLVYDGVIGDKTFIAAYKADKNFTIVNFCANLERYYRSLSNFHVFGEGWLNRIRFTLRHNDNSEYAK